MLTNCESIEPSQEEEEEIEEKRYHCILAILEIDEISELKDIQTGFFKVKNKFTEFLGGWEKKQAYQEYQNK